MFQMDFAKKIACLYQDEGDSAWWKTNSDTLVTLMILFEKDIISMVIISDNRHHDKRIVIPYSFTVFNYVKEMLRENAQNINIWTDMAQLVSLSLDTLVKTLLRCFFIIIMQHGIIQLQVMERGLWMSWRHHKMIS